MRYKESVPFYHTARWRRVREMALARDGYMCRDCMARYDAGYGVKPRRAVLVHHIRPIEERPDLACNLDNLIALCDECHNKRHPEKGRDGVAKTTPPMRVIKV